MAAIVALVERRQDVRRVIGTVAVGLDDAVLSALRRRRHGQPGLVGRGRDGGPRGASRGGEQRRAQGGGRPHGGMGYAEWSEDG